MEKGSGSLWAALSLSRRSWAVKENQLNVGQKVSQLAALPPGFLLQALA